MYGARSDGPCRCNVLSKGVTAETRPDEGRIAAQPGAATTDFPQSEEECLRLQEQQLLEIAEFPEYIRLAHRRSIWHRAEVEQSARCGCFHCCATFASQDIRQWVDGGQTALCPRCDIDSVLPGVTQSFLSRGFLARMRSYWFSRHCPDG